MLDGEISTEELFTLLEANPGVEFTVKTPLLHGIAWATHKFTHYNSWGYVHQPEYGENNSGDRDYFAKELSGMTWIVESRKD